MKITRTQLRRIIKEVFSSEEIDAEVERQRPHHKKNPLKFRGAPSSGHVAMTRMAAEQEYHRAQAEDALYGNPAAEMSLDWDDFLDMSDQAEAYDWLTRHNITDRKIQDELVDLWDLDADALDVDETYAMIKRK